MIVVALMVVVGATGVPRASALTAAAATPQLSITASGATSVGLQIFANSNLTGGAGPTGTITFTMFGPGDVSCTSVLFSSTVAVSGTSMNSARFTTTAAGTYRWQSTYNGDANNNRVGPTACSSVTASVVVERAGATLNVTAPLPVAGAIHGSATLQGGYNPTGTLSFSLSPPGDSFCSTSVYSTTVAVNLAGVYVSAPFTPTVSGTYIWRASYSGDANTGGVSPTNCLDANAKVTVSVGTSPGVAISPGTISFAAQTVASSSAAQTVTMTNTGNGALAISLVALAGTNPGDFRTGTDTCTATSVAPGGRCSVAVSFAPTAAGARSATLTVADNAATSPQTVSLNGTGSAGQAMMTYPTDGQSNVDTTRAFTWSTVPAAQGYYLTLGTAALGYDLVNSGALSTTQSSFSVPPLPGGTIYATLFTQLNGTWTTYQAITFTASPLPTTFLYPVNGQANVDTTRPFAWSAVPGAQAYYLIVGTTPNSYDLVNSGSLPTTPTSFSVGALPAGATLYATLIVQLAGTWTRYNAVTFTAAARAATVTYPANGQSGVDTFRPITWSSVPGAQNYYVMVGTTAGGYDQINSGALPATQTSLAMPALPTALLLYLTFYVQFNGAWISYQTATFTAAPGAASMTNPTNGQVNVDTTKPFTWTTIPGAQGYYLIIGTVAFGADLVNTGALPAGQSSLTVPDLPTGRTLYLTLFTEVNGTWSRYQAITFVN